MFEMRFLHLPWNLETGGRIRNNRPLPPGPERYAYVENLLQDSSLPKRVTG